MSGTATCEHLAAITPRYRKASRAEKQAILKDSPNKFGEGLSQT